MLDFFYSMNECEEGKLPDFPPSFFLFAIEHNKLWEMNTVIE